ncbi:hypothetical protein BASA81_006146 [Batrachochytrium salamandrivorans]|nr:hypothetical protein BASA81_006146 [Batrachochytrium salamandrivorans]
MKQQQPPQNDPALEAFEKLRVREVEDEYNLAAFAFLAKFQSTATILKPDERIKINANYMHENVESLKAVFSDPQANKICALFWGYGGYKGGKSIIPLLINNCPELASLEVHFMNHSAFDFVSSVLEHPSNKIKVLEMPPNTKGDSARFFAALGQSQVSALTLSHSPKSVQGLHEYLAKDLLVRLKVRMGEKQLPSEMMMSLVDCTRLVKLELIECEFSQSTVFTLPKSITRLELDNCTFVGDFDWSFLADSNVRKLYFFDVRGVDGTQRGSALAVHLRAKGLDELCFYRCNFVDETLAAIGLGVGRIKKLSASYAILNDASFAQIALALLSPNSEMKELVLPYDDRMASSIETHLVPALKHPNCNLAKLSLSTYGGGAKVAEHFHKRLALFVLLQGRQVRRRYCPLRRLPVEMFRLVGKMLL